MGDSFLEHLSVFQSGNESDPLPGLIFIPDISGFTRFVHVVDIDMGRFITNELLSVVMQENDLRLNVCEIEGDAIFFYRYGSPPSAGKLLAQYISMLDSFNKRLSEINQELGTEFDLSLKVIAHYGPIAEYQLGGFNKLYGNTVVEAHVLLKNDIASHSYALLTEELLTVCGDIDFTWLPQGIQSRKGNSISEDIQHITYTFFDFSRHAS